MEEKKFNFCWKSAGIGAAAGILGTLAVRGIRKAVANYKAGKQQAESKKEEAKEDKKETKKGDK